MDNESRKAVFLADFRLQREQVEKIYAMLQEKQAGLKEDGSATQEKVESIGYWLHNLYCAYEDLFKLTAGFWENSIGFAGDYHIRLLRRMVVDIEGIRPALLSEDSHKLLNDLRGFRHVFRHAYSFGLDAERVLLLMRRILDTKDLLLGDLKRFEARIAALDLEL
jgi:hypothetical protein